MEWRYPWRDTDDPFATPPDTLGLEAEEMRRLGYKVVDMVVDRALRRNAEPVVLTGRPDALMERLGGPVPEGPGDADAAIELLAELALSHMQHGDHTRYFARVPGPAAFAAILGEWLGTGFNTICSSWAGASGPATVEIVAVRWIAEMMGLPERTEGVFLSGGSVASLTAFGAGFAEVGRGVVYLGDQTHASLPRDLRLMGLPEDHLRVIVSDDDLRMPVAALAGAIARDRAAGLAPAMVIGTAGTTNTGAVDPLAEIADLCAAEGLWFHIDGAYGGPAAMTEAGRPRLAGIERADSVVIDPHKWLFQPYDAGLCMVTRPGALERAFAMTPEYLKDVQGGTGEVGFGNRSPELSRRSRALKVWLSLRTYGAARFREAVARGIALAEVAETYLAERADIWEVVSPAQLGIVCFALRGAGPGEHARRARAVQESGYASVSSTELKGRSVLRLCLINPLTTEEEIARTIDMLAAA